jgi:hypothetical protein
MNDATKAASPRWVRRCRAVFCFLVAALICWRGIVYVDPNGYSAALPFLMCQMTAAVVGLLGLMYLLGTREYGPS